MRAERPRRPSRAESAPAPRYTRRNLSTWERIADWYEAHNDRSLRRYDARAWGTWRVPERRLALLGEVRGKAVLELGCGAGWWSIALAEDGARPVGLDFSAKRLTQARARMRRAGVDFPLVCALAERIPSPDSRFDIVLSDYGATTFTDPLRTVPEAMRVLRDGGLFVFAHASPFRTVAQDLRTDRLERRLIRDYFGPREIRSPDSVEFQLGYGAWIELFRSCGGVVERLVEPKAPPRWRSTYFSARDQAWGRRWPTDALWKVRKLRRLTGEEYRPRPRRGSRGGSGRAERPGRSR